MASEEVDILNDADQSIELDDEEASNLQVFDLGLGVVADDGQGQFRFNPAGVYISRETAVLVRCVVVERVHGKVSVSASDHTPCSLLVFDFQFDRLQRTRRIDEATVSLILRDVEVVRIAPKDRISFDSLEQKIVDTNKLQMKAGIKYVGSLEAGGSHKTATETTLPRYAFVRGWTTHWPRQIAGDSSPDNCVKWFVEKNEAGKDGIPPHMRVAVLLKRKEDQEDFQLEMEIDSTADLRTGTEDLLRRLRGGTQRGQLKVDATLPPTNTLRTYTDADCDELGTIDLKPWGRLSNGLLQKKRFH
jgi:hypothetical protein